MPARPILFSLLFLCIAAGPVSQPATAPAVLPGPDFRTVENCLTAAPQKLAAQSASQPGYLGVSVVLAEGRVRVESVEPASPAAEAGLLAGDLIASIDKQSLRSTSDLEAALLSLRPGQRVEINIDRQGKPLAVIATLAAPSLPRKLSEQRAVMGITLKDLLVDTTNTAAKPTAETGAVIDRVNPRQPADIAGIRAGDVLLEIDGQTLANRAALSELLAGYAPDDSVSVKYRREGKLLETKVTLTADTSRPSAAYTPSAPERSTWKSPVYRPIVVCIEYPDIKHNPAITAAEWEKMFFSTGVYTQTNATGQKVFGSLNDFYQEVSVNKFRIEGKVFDWITVDKKRSEYGQPNPGPITALLTESLDKLLAKHGKDLLKDYDGIFFIYAGQPISTNRGNLYWPHKGSLTYGGKRWPFFICPEGGNRQANISTYCHEFGHMIGLPDLYARPENPGSEGLGNWCLMSNQIMGGQPQHPSAWCKERLGWLTPVTIDPTVKQKLVLSPVEGTTNQCFKVLLRRDGSEYLLLENRKKTGFDASLPGEGLLIWRVVRGHPILEESHGVEGPAGPRSYASMVPYPSAANHAFTPYTTPSSKSQLGGGMNVFITNITRLPDGRITFHIGYEFH